MTIRFPEISYFESFPRMALHWFVWLSGKMFTDMSQLIFGRQLKTWTRRPANNFNWTLPTFFLPPSTIIFVYNWICIHIYIYIYSDSIRRYLGIPTKYLYSRYSHSRYSNWMGIPWILFRYQKVDFERSEAMIFAIALKQGYLRRVLVMLFEWQIVHIFFVCVLEKHMSS